MFATSNANVYIPAAPRTRGGRGRGRGRGRKTRVIESDEEPSPEQLQEDAEEIEEKTVQPPAPSLEEKENEIVPPTSKLMSIANRSICKFYTKAIKLLSVCS